MRSNKGITLISLVVTIIVLLILAGVSIAMLSGDNSILTRAQETGYKTQLSNAQDVIGTAITEQVANYMNFKYVDSSATNATGNSTYSDNSSILTAIQYGVDSGCASLGVTGSNYSNNGSLNESKTPELKVDYKEKIIRVSYNGYATVGTVSDSGILKWGSIVKNSEAE